MNKLNSQLVSKLAEVRPYNEAVAIAIFAVERDLQDFGIVEILNYWELYIQFPKEMGYPMEIICSFVLDRAIGDPKNYGMLSVEAVNVTNNRF